MLWSWQVRAKWRRRSCIAGGMWGSVVTSRVFSGALCGVSSGVASDLSRLAKAVLNDKPSVHKGLFVV